MKKTLRSQMFTTAASLTLLAVTIVGFQNCSVTRSAIHSDAQTSQCTSKTMNDLKAAALYAPIPGLVCDDVSHYQCVHRIFRPGAGDSEAVVQSCVAEKDANGQRVCLTLQELRFDTNAARSLQGQTPGAFNEGGEFNNESFECHHTKALVKNEAILTREASSLDEAWNLIHYACLEKKADAGH